MLLDNIIASAIAVGCAIGVGIASIVIACFLCPRWTMEKVRRLWYIERSMEDIEDIIGFSRTVAGNWFLEFRAHGGYKYEARQYPRNFPHAFDIEDMISEYTGDKPIPFMLAFMIDNNGVARKHPIEFAGRRDSDSNIVRTGYRLSPRNTISAKIFLNFEPNLPIRESPVALFERKTVWAIVYNFVRGIGPFIMAIIRLFPSWF